MGRSRLGKKDSKEEDEGWRKKKKKKKINRQTNAKPHTLAVEAFVICGAVTVEEFVVSASADASILAGERGTGGAVFGVGVVVSCCQGAPSRVVGKRAEVVGPGKGEGEVVKVTLVDGRWDGSREKVVIEGTNKKKRPHEK